MGKGSHCSVLHLLLLSFLIILSQNGFSCHESKQARVHGDFQKSKLRGDNAEMDKSDYKVKEIDHNRHVYLQEGMKEKDRILRLPGQPVVRFSQYGGYVTVDKEAGRAFYYYLVEAMSNKESLPLLLWLNGAIPVCYVFFSAAGHLLREYRKLLGRWFSPRHYCTLDS